MNTWRNFQNNTFEEFVKQFSEDLPKNLRKKGISEAICNKIIGEIVKKHQDLEKYL